MDKYYIVTMWSGGEPGKKWKTMEKPQLLEKGTGFQFTDMNTKLTVEVVGDVSVEEYEHGLEYPEDEQLEGEGEEAAVEEPASIKQPAEDRSEGPDLLENQ